MTKKFGLIAVIFIAVGAIVGGIFGKMPTITSADTALTPQRVVSDYREALDVIDENYAGKVDHESITESSMQSMLWTLDPHSSFFTSAEFEKLTEEQASQFYGIGVSIMQRHNGVYVESVIPNTPADKAGLRFGDRFVKIDGKEATEWTSSEVSRNVRGERGTKVNLLIERASAEKPVEFNIVRGGVPLPSIRNYFMLDDGVGYIGFVGGFQETSSDELNLAIEDLENQGMKSLILDIRGNPGGLLPQAIEIVGRFIPDDKTVVSVKGRSRYARSQELRTSGAADDHYPLVVLVNGSSASASEIVAGALQDYGRALIVGTDSFGKGLVQRVFQLPFGTGLTLTTARYYTPFGRSLQRDYSSGSIYEYYTHSNSMSSAGGDDAPEPKPAGSPVTTPDGRVLYGGRGIEPDVVVKPEEFGELKFRINEAAFFFVRQLVAGKIAGLESYKTEKQDQLTLLPPDALPVTDKLYEAFRKFAASEKALGLSSANIDSASDFAKLRVRQELATATHSNEAGVQVLLEADPQVLKGAELMPRAAALVDKSIAFQKQ